MMMMMIITPVPCSIVCNVASLKKRRRPRNLVLTTCSPVETDSVPCKPGDATVKMTVKMDLMKKAVVCNRHLLTYLIHFIPPISLVSSLHIGLLLPVFFIAACNVCMSRLCCEHDVRPSVRLSVTLVECDHLGPVFPQQINLPLI